MIYSVAGQLPTHLYVYVDSAFTHKEPRGFIPALWFGLVSFPARMWGCTVLLENGAVYRNLPPHAIAFRPDAPDWTPGQAQHWDCYGTDFACLEYEALKTTEITAKTADEWWRGSYLFTAIPVGDAYSKAPDQAKEFTFVRLHNGRLTVQPTDRVVFWDASFTVPGELPVGLRRQTETYSCERSAA